MREDTSFVLTGSYSIGGTGGGGGGGTPTKIELSATADETINAGDLIRFVLNGEVGLITGRVVKAIATSPATADVLGIASSSATQGNSITFVPYGQTAVNFSGGSPPATTDIGQNVYLSTTSGLAVVSPPSGSGQAVVRIGKLVNADGVTTSLLVVLNIEYIINL